MKYLFYFSGLTFLLAACTAPALTSEEIARKCAAYHDTDGLWYDKVVELELESVFIDDNVETIMIKIDNQSNTYEYNNLFRGVHVAYRPDTCIAYNDSSSCENYAWTSRFYEYIWGMPAKFFDPGIQVEEAFEEVMFNEVPVYAIHIEHETEHWDYYINRNSFYLEGFQFVKKEGGKGEIVYNKGSRNVNGMIMPTHRTWYNLEMELLGTDVLK